MASCLEVGSSPWVALNKLMTSGLGGSWGNLCKMGQGTPDVSRGAFGSVELAVKCSPSLMGVQAVVEAAERVTSVLAGASDV